MLFTGLVIYFLNIFFGLYLLNISFHFITIPFSSFIDSWMIFFAGVVMLWGISGNIIAKDNANPTKSFLIGLPWIIVSLYFLTYPFNLITIPQPFLSWIITLGGILCIIGIFFTHRVISGVKAGTIK